MDAGSPHDTGSAPGGAALDWLRLPPEGEGNVSHVVHWEITCRVLLGSLSVQHYP